MKRRDRREFHKRRLCIGRVSGGLIGNLGLSVKDMTKGEGKKGQECVLHLISFRQKWGDDVNRV